MKGKDITEEFKEEYKSLAELLEAVPDDVLFFKKKMEIRERRTENMHDLLLILYRMKRDAKEDQTHYGDRCVAFMRERNAGAMKRIDQKRLRKELAELLVQALDPKSFIDDYVMTLDPMDLLEAYDRAVVKKGKIKAKEGCYKFEIHGQRGKPQELMLTP
jgi:hypothetical protein